jgi:hypothetical protein
VAAVRARKRRRSRDFMSKSVDRGRGNGQAVQEPSSSYPAYSTAGTQILCGNKNRKGQRPSHERNG